MLDEFRKLVNETSACHRSSSSFVRDLIRLIAEYSRPINQVNEDEQELIRLQVAGRFCLDWQVTWDWVRSVLDLYLPVMRTDVGEAIRVFLTEQTKTNVVQMRIGIADLIQVPRPDVLEAQVIDFITKAR